MKKFFLLFLMISNFIVADHWSDAYHYEGVLQNLEPDLRSFSEVGSEYDPIEQANIDRAVREMQTNFSLIHGIRELCRCKTMRYADIKPVSDYVINKLYEEKSFCLLYYFYCVINNDMDNCLSDMANAPTASLSMSDQIRDDIDDKIHLLELEIEKALSENKNAIVRWR